MSIFNGVTYAAISVIPNTNDWFSRLNSKLLSFSHLKWIENYLNSDINMNEGLLWSPLNSIFGSSFITINDQNGNTYSCFGSWETDNKILLNNIRKACSIVKTASWNSNIPVDKNTIQNILHSNYSISITLIPPITFWNKIDFRKKNQLPINRGYVYYNKSKNTVGMTYLPSVWKQLNNRNDFFEGLCKKHTNVYNKSSGFKLYYYDSISWNLDIKT